MDAHNRLSEQERAGVPEQLRALALVAFDDSERGLTFIMGFFILRASRATQTHTYIQEKGTVSHFRWLIDILSV